MDQPIYEQLYRFEDRHWWFRGRRAVIRALLDGAGLPPEPRLLDAGCGTGRNLAEFGDPRTARGIDPSPQAVEFCRQRGLEGVSVGRLEALPFGDAEFDLMLLCDVIEHVEDDVAALRELRRVSAPGGALVITAPAYRWLWSSHDEAHHHHRRYTRPELERRAREAGWRPVRATYFNTILLPAVAAVRKLRPHRSYSGRSDAELTPGALNPVLEQPMRLEAALIRRGASLPFGVSIGLRCEPAV